MNIIDDVEKIYIYSKSKPQDLLHEIIKRFSNYIPMKRVPNEEQLGPLIDEIGNDKDLEKSETETESYQ